MKYIHHVKYEKNPRLLIMTVSLIFFTILGLIWSNFCSCVCTAVLAGNDPFVAKKKHHTN